MKTINPNLLLTNYQAINLQNAQCFDSKLSGLPLREESIDDEPATRRIIFVKKDGREYIGRARLSLLLGYDANT